MQPKAKTLQERMGFRDDELTTPKHDEIMLWLNDNASHLFPDGSGKPWEKQQIQRAYMEAQEVLTGRWKEKEEEAKSKIKSEIWSDILETVKREFPIKEEPRKFGQYHTSAEDQWRWKADKKVKDYISEHFSFPNCPAAQTGDLPERLGTTQITWEKPVLSGTYTVGFIDMEIITTPSRLISIAPQNKDEYRFEWGQEPCASIGGKYLIEVKPKIESLGEVIRQIRFYQTHCHGRFYICCPDNRFEKQLASQGIGFIKAEV